MGSELAAMQGVPMVTSFFLAAVLAPGERPVRFRTNHPTAAVTCQSRLPGNGPAVLWHRELAGPSNPSAGVGTTLVNDEDLLFVHDLLPGCVASTAPAGSESPRRETVLYSHYGIQLWCPS